MARKNNGEKELRWRDIVGRQPKSGLSIREFCAKERVSQPSFYAWRRRLREAEATAMQPRVNGRGVDKSRTAGEFIPLKLLDSAAVWEVVHPLGYRVRVSGEVKATALQCILEVLDGRAQG